MRTTVTLHPDVAAAVAALQRERRVGVSAALNEIARRGLISTEQRPKFHQETSELGLRIDVRNVAEALDLLDDSSDR